MKLIPVLLLLAAPVMADPMLIDDFSDGAENRWRYTSDQVMGGVSEGGASLGAEDGITFAQLRGMVSTANNGGFIQIRQDLPGSRTRPRASHCVCGGMRQRTILAKDMS